MNRHYEMTVEIEKYDVKRYEAIKTAAAKELPFDDWFEREDWCEREGKKLTMSGEVSLGIGKTEGNFSERLAREVFKANGKPCSVRVTANLIKDLPHETYKIYVFDENNLPSSDLRSELILIYESCRDAANLFGIKGQIHAKVALLDISDEICRVIREYMDKPKAQPPFSE